MRQKKLLFFSIQRLFLVFFFVISIFVPSAFATTHLPDGLLAGEAYTHEQAATFLLTFSFFAAFLAGIITLFSPCILPLVPAYFSYTFKEKTKISIMTLSFFLGFTLMFIALGIGATLLGVASLSLLQEKISFAIQIAGALILLFGIMTFFGGGFSGIILRKRTENDIAGVFLYGILFALGWTACIGPVLAGILTMTAVFHNYLTAALFMFFYSLGIFFPLFLLSLFYDRFFMQKLQQFFGKTIDTSLSNILSGILLICIGLVFIIWKGTAPINGFSYFGLKEYFYTLQRLVLERL